MKTSISYLETIYNNMVSRCCNTRHPDFKYYGAKKIKVCKRWLGRFGMHRFVVDVLRHLGPRPEIGKWCIDRIDSAGNYTIKNLRWSTMLESERNKKPGNRWTKDSLMMSNSSSGLMSTSLS